MYFHCSKSSWSLHTPKRTKKMQKKTAEKKNTQIHLYRSQLETCEIQLFQPSIKQATVDARNPIKRWPTSDRLRSLCFTNQPSLKPSVTPLKIVIEPENDGWEDDFPFPAVKTLRFQPLIFRGVSNVKKKCGNF